MSLHAWGKGDNGQLGLGSTEDSLVPAAIRSIPGNVIKVAGGWKHFLAINDLGDVYAWGRGREGQHGSGKRQNFLAVPQKVQALNGDRIVGIGCGSNHCLAINQKGQVYQWGMGHKYGEDQEVFGSIVAMPGMANESRKEWVEKRKKMIERSAKEYMKGLEGIAEENLKLDYVTPEVNNFGKWVNCIQLQPTLIEELSNEKVKKVIGGYGYSFAITEDGKLYSWGVNDKRQLGLGHRCNEGKPQLVKSLCNQGVKVVDLDCGSQHVIALSSEGHMYSFGLGVFGQLGHGELFNETFPKRIEAISDVKIVKISCGSHHSLALSDEGAVYTWGSSEYGQQCGANEYTDWQAGDHQRADAKERKYFFSVPRKIEGAFGGEKVVNIGCGDLHNVALTDSGEVYTWGWGIHGALGHGDRGYRHFPSVVSQLRGEKMADIDTCGTSTFALSASGNTIFAFDFQGFVNNQLHSDLQFVFENERDKDKTKIIYAHKVIVCARCPDLKKLIDEQAEKDREIGNTGPTKLPLEGVEYFLFLSLLKYLYTDNLIAVSYHVPKLKVMAETYGLDRLSKLCKRYTGNLNKDEETVPPSTWAQDLQGMINSQSYSDFSLRLQGDETVFAHKMMLSARTDYFKTIFEGAFSEGSKHEMEIKEISSEVFQLVLTFIYTNQTKFEGHEDAIVDLLLAAGRFLLEELKQRIEKMLEEELDSENGLDLLLISETAQAPKLRNACIDLISANLPDFKTNEGYNVLARLYPHTKRHVDFLYRSQFEKENQNTTLIC